MTLYTIISKNRKRHRLKKRIARFREDVRSPYRHGQLAGNVIVLKYLIYIRRNKSPFYKRLEI